MRRNSLHTGWTLLFAILCGAAIAAESTPRLDPLVIHGKHVKRAELAKLIDDLQERLYYRYNKLNTIRDLAVECREETPTGTLLRTRNCRPVFQSNAERDYAAAAFRDLYFRTGTAGQP